MPDNRLIVSTWRTRAWSNTEKVISAAKICFAFSFQCSRAIIADFDTNRKNSLHTILDFAKGVVIFAAAFEKALSGEMSEWFKEHAWKVCIRLKRIRGSNPRLSASPAEARRAKAGNALPIRSL